MRRIERYLDFVKESEAPVQFHRWSFISGVSAMLGRNVWLPFGHSCIYPNQYIMLVGSPGVKKSSAINVVKGLIEDSDYDWFSYTKTSKQKFLLDWSERMELGGTGNLDAFLDAPISTDKIVSQMYCCLDEFIDFIGVNNFEFISLLTTLWDNLKKYDERLKNSASVSIMKPTVNMLGGITPTSLAKALPSESDGQGFFSRILMVYSSGSGRKITFPPIPDQEERQNFVRFFASLRGVSGEATLTPAAKEAIDEIYHKWENRIDVKLEYYSSRRLIHLFKLCMTLAAVDFDTKIDLPHVVEANTILCYTERNMAKALRDFGNARNLVGVGKIMEALSASSNGLTPQEIWKQTMSYFDRLQDLLVTLSTLQTGGKIQHHNDRIFLVKEAPIQFGDLVDYETYIREFKPETEAIIV